MGGKASSTKLSSRIVRSIEAIGQILARHPSKGMLIGGRMALWLELPRHLAMS
jgi:hypothetical protein